MNIFRERRSSFEFVTTAASRNDGVVVGLNIRLHKSLIFSPCIATRSCAGHHTPLMYRPVKNRARILVSSTYGRKHQCIHIEQLGHPPSPQILECRPSRSSAGLLQLSQLTKPNHNSWVSSAGQVWPTRTYWYRH